MRRVVVVGGGITGLAVAYRVGLAGAEVTVLERRDRLGGNILTEKVGGFTIDAGPDAWVATKPHATALAKELGLAREIVGTIEENRRVYIATEDGLHALPEGMVLGVPTRVGPMLQTPVFGWDAKLRMGLELVVPKRTYAEGEDESIASFFTRRFGDELTDRLAAPLLGGIFAGDAADLSVRATFPQLVEMEQKYGSLLRAMWERAKEMRAQHAQRAGEPGAKKGPPSAFLTLTEGLGRLVERLVESLQNTTIRTGPRGAVREVRRREGGGYDVELESGEALACDDVALTAPAHALVPMVAGLDADLADELSALRYASTVTVFLGVARADVAHALDATGFLVPRSLGRPLLAGTWVSSKWPNRAPPGYALLKAFFGGAWGEDVLDRADADLVELARSELARLMGPIGAPTFSRVYRHRRASPQPVIGHLARMAALRARAERHPGLYIAGNGFDGSGIPDCIKQAEAVAQAVLAR